VCRAIQDPTRREILDALRDRDYAAGELAALFPVSRPAISKHLRVLREARLVAERRTGRHRIYRLDPAPLQSLDQWLGHYRLFWAARLHDLKQVVEAEARRPPSRNPRPRGSS
jgi:DNA-binding transcriptional ArsR family regulator